MQQKTGKVNPSERILLTAAKHAYDYRFNKSHTLSEGSNLIEEGA